MKKTCTDCGNPHHQDGPRCDTCRHNANKHHEPVKVERHVGQYEPLKQRSKLDRTT